MYTSRLNRWCGRCHAPACTDIAENIKRDTTNRVGVSRFQELYIIAGADNEETSTDSQELPDNSAQSSSHPDPLEMGLVGMEHFHLRQRRIFSAWIGLFGDQGRRVTCFILQPFYSHRRIPSVPGPQSPSSTANDGLDKDQGPARAPLQLACVSTTYHCPTPQRLILKGTWLSLSELVSTQA
jgi:hypothetical protein